MFSKMNSDLALNVISMFPHPDLVSSLTRTKIKNLLLKSTDKRISKKNAMKYSEKLLEEAKISRPAARLNDYQVQEVLFYAGQLKTLMSKKESIKEELIRLSETLPEFEIIYSMPGIGKITTALLIGEIGDFTRFDNANQLNAYVGIDLIRYQSGNGFRGDHINKRGNPKARALLFLIVKNMIRGQHYAPNHIINYYYKLKKQPMPKKGKVAIVACINKTLKCLLSMIKNRDKYVYTYTNSKSTEMN